MVSHIYFDWSGTLAKPVRRGTLKRGQCKALYPDVRPMLAYLCHAGYTLGMITNSDKERSFLIGCLSAYGLLPYFKGAIVVASMRGMKKKPAPVIFRRALELDGIDAADALMVGNDFYKDIVGAGRVGMRTAFVDRTGAGPQGREDIYVKNILELGMYLK